MVNLPVMDFFSISGVVQTDITLRYILEQFS